MVMPSKERQATFATKGMAWRLGAQTEQSWALSHTHIAYMNVHFHRTYNEATLHTYWHEVACAATANLLAYLGWLRGTELFDAASKELAVVDPKDGEIHELPPHVGAVALSLLEETKSNPCQVAALVMAYETLPGLDLGY
jgi:hypothetical protein